MTAWNDFVKKIYHEGHKKDKNYSFKQALQDGSKRKGEMGSSSSSSSSSSKMTKSKGKKSKKMRKETKSSKKGGNKCGMKAGTRRRRRKTLNI
jgi:hypothetical protein